MDFLSLVESKGYEDYVVDACSKIVAMAAIEQGIDTTENDVEIFTSVVVNGEPRLANVRVTTDMLPLTDKYVYNGVTNPVQGTLYICSKEGNIVNNVSVNPPKQDKHDLH